MATLQGMPTMASTIDGVRKSGFFTALIPKQLCVNSISINSRKISGLRIMSDKCGFGRGIIRLRNYPNSAGASRIVRCHFSSSNDGDRVAGDSLADGTGDYVKSSVIEAVEVRNGSDAFLIKMRDGQHISCLYNNPRGGFPPDNISHRAMVLKLEDGSGLLFPIVVLEMPSTSLMDALCNVKTDRPTVYEIVAEMIESMGYKVKYVRVTTRVLQVYFAEIWVTNDQETEGFSLDIRPSDAINIAVRCKAPILVNKSLAHNAGLRIVEPAKSPSGTPRSDDFLLSEMDRPGEQPSPETEEFILLQNMFIAAAEERYHDAAQFKELLEQFRFRRLRFR